MAFIEFTDDENKRCIVNSEQVTEIITELEYVVICFGSHHRCYVLNSFVETLSVIINHGVSPREEQIKALLN